MIKKLSPGELDGLGVPFPKGTLAWALAPDDRLASILTACPLGAGDWGSEGFAGKPPSATEALALVEATAMGLNAVGGRVWISFGELPTFKTAGTLLTLEASPLSQGRGGARPARNATEGALQCAPTGIGEEATFAALVRACQQGSLDFPEIPHVPKHLTLEPYKGYGTSLWRRCGDEGVVIVNAVDQRTAHLAFFGLVPEARGRGLGTDLLIAALDLAGIRTLTAAVDACNAPALALYKKLGFRETGRKQLLWRDLRG